jgi:hypothetical protein
MGRAAGQQAHVTLARMKSGANRHLTAAPADVDGDGPGGSPACMPVTSKDVTALEESVREDDYDSPRLQAMAGNLIRREQDQELIAKRSRNN